MVFRSILLCVFIFSAPVLQAAGNVEAGKEKAATCMGCHGIPSYSNVYPTYHVPRLGNQHAEYIVEALKAYKNKQRSHLTMQAQAVDLSAEDMADIAAYFSQFGDQGER